MLKRRRVVGTDAGPILIGLEVVVRRVIRTVIDGIIGRLLESGGDLWSFMAEQRQEGEKEVRADARNIFKQSKRRSSGHDGA